MTKPSQIGIESLSTLQIAVLRESLFSYERYTTERANACDSMKFPDLYSMWRAQAGMAQVMYCDLSVAGQL